MSSYLTIAVVCLLLITEARLKTTFRLTRGLKDKFTNTECVNRNSCSASQCAQYFARCDTESCGVCVCDERMPTFVASQKRCVKDDDIFPQTVPEYSSFVISSPGGEPYVVASKTSNRLDYDTKYTGNPNQLWLYTPSKKLLNLKAQKCLDFKDPTSVALRQCTVENSTTQMWYCNRSSVQLYGKHDGTTSNLDFSGHKFYMGDELGKWVANKGLDAPSQSICDIPDTYRGCYRFTDGSSVKRFAHQSQLIDCTEAHDGECYEKFRISAPIFKANGYSASCHIVWHNSMISVNNMPWTNVNIHDSPFHYVGEETTPGEIEFRFLESAKTLWSGALLKLDIECQNGHRSKTKLGTERHCMLLKFDGVFEESLYKHLLTTRPTKTPDSPKSGTEPSNPDSRYKSVAIAMSVLLAFFFLLAIVVAFITYRRRSPRSWVTASPHDDITAKPFYNSDEHL